MKQTIIALILMLLAPGMLLAGPQEGILREFRAAEEALRARGTTEEDRRKVLENNLIRGVEHTIMRMFYNKKKELLADLKPENLGYENPTSPRVYYVKYKDLIIRFDFATDPERYIQAPVLKKILVIDEALKKDMEKIKPLMESGQNGGGNQGGGQQNGNAQGDQQGGN